MLVDTTIQIIQQALVLCNINYNLKSLVFRNLTFQNIAIKITYFRVFSFSYHSMSFVTTCKQVSTWVCSVFTCIYKRKHATNARGNNRIHCLVVREECLWVAYRYHSFVVLFFFVLKATETVKVKAFSKEARGRMKEEVSKIPIEIFKSQLNSHTSGKDFPAERLYIFTLFGCETCIMFNVF